MPVGPSDADYQAPGHLLRQAAQLLAGSQRVVVFTGAGISTESGIPDFRSPGGLWERYPPVQYQEFIRSRDARVQYWRMHGALYETVRQAQPNAAHQAIVTLDRMGKLDCVITQNIDYLHQRAGLSDDKVLELHGTVRWVICLQCSARYERDEVQRRLEQGESEPRCAGCGGMLKPATISFGQAMPERETAEAIRRSKMADLFLVLGSSLVVYPAADMPIYAVESGARLIIINMAATPLDTYATIAIHARIGAVLPRIVEMARGQP